MSYSEVFPAFRRWIEVLLREKLQIAKLAAIGASGLIGLAALAITLIHLLDSQDYRLRIALPDSTSVPIQSDREVAEAGTSLAEIPADEAGADAALVAQRDNSAAFDKAFLDFQTRRRQNLRPGELIAIDYDIAELDIAPEKFDRSDGSLTVQKPLFVDGVSSGPATIRIEDGAQILIATSSVARALGDRANTLPRRISTALADGSGFIPFYELRGAGITVEYDASRDRVSMTMPPERGG